jgi:hypothetical protein
MAAPVAAASEPPTNRAPKRDFPYWLLNFVVALVPSRRREWALAIRAELASIDNYAARRSFAVSALRAMLSVREVAARLLLAGPLVASASVALSGAFGHGSAGYSALVISMVALIVLLSCAGLRYGRLGPVAPTVGARVLRASLFLMLDVWLLEFGNTIGRHDSIDLVGSALAVVATTSYCLVALTVTSVSAVATESSAVAGGLAGMLGVATWWCVFVISPTLRLHPHAGLVVVAGTAIVAMFVAAGRRSALSMRGALVTALCAVNASCWTIFITAKTTYQVRPSLVPRISHIPYGGLTPADLIETDRIEAIDPYVAYLLLGALMSLVLLPVLRRSAHRVA